MTHSKIGFGHRDFHDSRSADTAGQAAGRSYSSSLRSKRSRGVGEQRKIEERSGTGFSVFWLREK